MKNKDSKIKSLSEAVFNILVGYSINFAMNVLVLPHYGIPFSWMVYTEIGIIFTFISLARTFLIRRLFVNGFYETIFGRKKGKNGRKANI